jgi:hypothetical protein
LRQSGQLLRTQKGDLSKRDRSSFSRSRSNSEAISDDEDEDEDEDDSEDDSSNGEEEGSMDGQPTWDSDDEDSPSQSDGDVFENTGTEMLLSQGHSRQFDSNGEGQYVGATKYSNKFLRIDRALESNEVYGRSDALDQSSWSGDSNKIVLSPSPSTEPSDSVKANDYTPPSTPPSEAVTIRPETPFSSTKTILTDHADEQALAAVKDGTSASDQNKDGRFGSLLCKNHLLSQTQSCQRCVS